MDGDRDLVLVYTDPGDWVWVCAPCQRASDPMPDLEMARVALAEHRRCAHPLPVAV